MLVAEDPLARSGLAHALASEGTVVVASEAADDAELERALATSRARVIVRDLGVGSPVGRERLRSAGVPLVALVPDEARASEALAAGARGVLLRTTDGARLAIAVTAVARGLVVLDDRLAPTLLERPRAIPAAGEDRLTPRELEVVDLLARGLANKEIAHRLKISEHTAKFHVNSILTKLGAESRTQAVVRAVQLGLVAL